MKINTFTILLIFVPCLAFAQPADLLPEDAEIEEAFKKVELLQKIFSQKIDNLNTDITQKEILIKNPFLDQFPKIKGTAVQEDPINNNIPVKIPNSFDENITPPTGEISGLVWNSDRPQAIIDDNVIDIGDKLEDWEVIGISKDGILLRSAAFNEYLLKP